MTRKPRSKSAALPTGRADIPSTWAGDAAPARFGPSSNAVAVSAVIARATDMGLMAVETRQVGARLPTKLLEQAKRTTGISSTTDLLAYALANIAIEDDFAAAFVTARGTLDPLLLRWV